MITSTISIDNAYLHKLVGGVELVQHLLNDRDSQRVYPLFVGLQVGRILSDCACLLNTTIPHHDAAFLLPLAKQISFISAKLLSKMAQHYFSETRQWEQHLEAPTTDHFKVWRTDIYRLRVGYILINEHKSSIVSALDSTSNKVIFATSAPVYGPRSSRYKSWPEPGGEFTDARNALKEGEIICSAKSPPKITLEMLYQVTAQWSRFAAENYHQKTEISTKIGNALDYNLILGRLFTALSTMHYSPDKEEIFESFRQRFENIFTESEWNELFNIVSSDSDLSEDAIKAIVRNKKFTAGQMARIWVAMNPCGELKIVLEKCRQVGKLSFAERQKLNQSLQETLTFSAVIKMSEKRHNKRTTYDHWIGSIMMNGDELRVMDLCKSCKKMWPIYEALYFGVRECGLDLAAIESLEQTILAAEASK